MSRLERHLAPVPRSSADVWQRAAPRPGRAGNLPWPTTTFVDRPELPQVLGVLDNPSSRLVTLVEPHGSGKTRLALAAAEAVAGAFADGVWFVDLAEGDAQDIVGLIAAALSVRPAVTTVEALAGAVGHWDALLLLDSVDAALAAGPTLVRLLAAAPGLKILATSRAPFGVAAEQRVPVPPLGTLASVALFCERAKAIDPRWAVTSANAAAVTELCARLEGLPLAIELATAWLYVLPADALLAHFPSTLDLLSTGGPDRPARHRTMRAAIAWSERRLTTDERALLQRLSVCRDGATVEALEGWSELPPGRTLGLLASLVGKSLVEVRSEPDGSLRYAVLRSVREYETELAVADGAVWGLRRDHAAFYTRLAEQVVTELGHGSRAGGCLAQLDRDMANVSAALEWSRSDSHPAAAELGRRLGAALVVLSSARAAGRWSRQLQRVDQPGHRSSSSWGGGDAGDGLGVAALSGALGAWSGGGSRARAGRPLRSMPHGACAGYPGDAPLSRRELEVVRLIGQGCTNREIGVRLCLSARTVDNHVHRILAKVGAPSRTALAVWAYRLGLVPDLAGAQTEQGTEAASAIAG